VSGRSELAGGHLRKCVGARGNVCVDGIYIYDWKLGSKLEKMLAQGSTYGEYVTTNVRSTPSCDRKGAMYTVLCVLGTLGCRYRIDLRNVETKMRKALGKLEGTDRIAARGVQFNFQHMYRTGYQVPNLILHYIHMYAQEGRTEAIYAHEFE